jgi:hypothetical protein
MNPSQLQLTTIAATMANLAENPTDTARRALQLWQACGDELERAAPALAKREQATAVWTAATQETRQWLSQFTPGEAVPLEVFLRAVMPQSKTEDRLKKWRDYLRSSVAFHDREQGGKPRTAAALESEVARLVKRDREHGIAHDKLAMSRESFENFLARDTAEKNRERGKKAAAAKKNRASAK